MRVGRGVLLSCGVMLALGPPAAVAAPAVTPSTVLHVTGRGEGHGVGLAKDSAEALARAGASREAILDRFYPSTTRARVESTTVRVLVWQGASGTAVETPYGGTLRADGRDWPLAAGDRVALSHDTYGYHALTTRRGAPRTGAARAAFRQADPTPTPTDEPTPQVSPSPSATATGSPSAVATQEPTAAAPDQINSASPLLLTPRHGGLIGVVSSGRSYRGTLSFDARTTPRLVNTVLVEEYLQGVTETAAGWPPAAQQAQVVAARTYALRALQASTRRPYDVCADSRCQTYPGAGAEDARRTAAVAATRGEVVLFHGQLADAVYSTNAGGVTAAASEGLGDGVDVPYLPAGRAAPGPLRPWRRDLDAVQVARALAYPGRVTGLRVTRRGPSGRVLEAAVMGSSGTRVANGLALATALRLPSTLYALSVTSGEGRALAPGLGAVQIQAPPDGAALAPVLAPAAAVPPLSALSAEAQPDLVALAAAPVPSTDTPELRWVATTAMFLALLQLARRSGRRRRRAQAS